LQQLKAISWLDDHQLGRQDNLSQSVVAHLGATRVRMLAETAEAAGHWAAATLRWTLVGTWLMEVHGLRDPLTNDTAGPFRRAAETVTKIVSTPIITAGGAGPGSDIQCTERCKTRLELYIRVWITKMWNPADFPVQIPLIIPLTKEMGRDDPALVAESILFLEIMFPMMMGDFLSNQVNGCYSYYKHLHEASVEHANTDLGRRFTVQQYTWGFMLDLFLSAVEHDGATKEDAYGEQGVRLYESWEMYSPEADHDYLKSKNGTNDPMVQGAGAHARPLLFLWGDVRRVRIIVAKMIELNWRFYKSNKLVEGIGMCMSAVELPLLCLMSGCPTDGFTFMKDFYGEYNQIESRCREMCVPHLLTDSKLAPTEGKNQEMVMIFSESYADYASMMWALCCPDGSLSADEAFSNMRTPREMEEIGSVTRGEAFNFSLLCESNTCTMAALALERYGRYEQALVYAKHACEPTMEGNRKFMAIKMNHWQFSLARSCCGRSLAALGRLEEAEAMFRLAVEHARAREYAFLEVLAVRDWNNCVRAPAGDGARGHAILDEALLHVGIGCKDEFSEVFDTLFVY
jgi:hypothetical protein